MSLVSAYPSAYASNPVDINSSVTSSVAASNNNSFYSHPHHHQSSSTGDYSGGQHQNFFPSAGWTWNGNTNPSVADFQPPASLAQQHSPSLSCYSSSAPSPDYYVYQQSQQQQHHHHPYETTSAVSSVDYHPLHHPSTVAAPRVIRVVKRRNTANKKERRRTMSINNAFSELRDCIPNVPADTKLSKIKTLRLATSYISYLMAVLEAGPETDIPFRAELGRQSKSEKAAAQQQQQQQQLQQQHQQQHQQQQFSVNIHHKEQPKEEEPNLNGALLCPSNGDKRSKGRTGWPHHVWALELKQ